MKISEAKVELKTLDNIRLNLIQMKKYFEEHTKGNIGEKTITAQRIEQETDIGIPVTMMLDKSISAVSYQIKHYQDIIDNTEVDLG